MIGLIDLATPDGAQAVAEMSLPAASISDGTQDRAQAASNVPGSLPAKGAAH